MSGRPCTCEQYEPGQPFELGRDCRLCWLAFHDTRYRTLWGQGDSASRSGPCAHLLADTGELVECPSCSGKVQLKVFGCAVHGKCTRGRRAGALACCQGCADYREVNPFTGDPVRHLLYHVYPVKANGVWQRNVAQLLRRIRLFNGHRIVAIVTDGRTDPAQHVIDQFAGHVHEFITLRNEPKLREVQTFLPLFERLQTCDPNAVALWAHAKGVTRPAGHPAHPWTETMHEVYLDYWPLVEQTLRQFPLAGAFKKHGQGWPANVTRSDWHYSGSWFWFRCKDVFGLPDWRRIDQMWTGIEPWPSQHFKPGDAACLFHEGQVPAVNLYSADYLKKRMLPDYETWKRAHQAERKDW